MRTLIIGLLTAAALAATAATATANPLIPRNDMGDTPFVIAHEDSNVTEAELGALATDTATASAFPTAAFNQARGSGAPGTPNGIANQWWWAFVYSQIPQNTQFYCRGGYTGEYPANLGGISGGGYVAGRYSILANNQCKVQINSNSAIRWNGSRRRHIMLCGALAHEYGHYAQDWYTAQPTLHSTSPGSIMYVTEYYNSIINGSNCGTMN
jgi:hypothetical protein